MDIDKSVDSRIREVEGRKGGREGGREGRKEERREGRKGGMKEGRLVGREEERKEGREEYSRLNNEMKRTTEKIKKEYLESKREETVEVWNYKDRNALI